MKSTEKPVVVEQSYDVSRDELWKAITQVDEMRQWFFDNIPEFEPVEGFETRFVVETENRTFPHLWKLTEVVPGEKITYDWRYEGYPGRALVTFELREDGNSMKLIVTYDGIESFPDDIPEFTRESCKGGWEYFIQQSLQEFLKPGKE
ncbi:MAG: SRPBCC domain-containing protein [Candidatus Marinimicrobia bacterium]|nr:SRPBCC domain-containing protein [Candidatus Neomarinimicrobiota bacterium]